MCFVQALHGELILTQALAIRKKKVRKSWLHLVGKELKKSDITIFNYTKSNHTKSETVYLHSDRPHTRSSAPVRNTEGFVEICVHNIGAIIRWSTNSNLLQETSNY